MYDHECQYCGGTVRAKKVAREAFKHKDGFVILEDVTVGVCDTCGNRYYSANILHRVHEWPRADYQPKGPSLFP